MVEVSVAKPLYDTFVYVWDYYLEKAMKTHQKLRIKTMDVERICTPEEWKTGAKKMEKVFKYKDRPMVLWGNYVVKKEHENKNQLRLINDKPQPVFDWEERTVRFI